MKALTISQPYASLIADGSKWCENRTWPTGYSGPLAIHAGKGTQYLDRSQLLEYPTGCVIAVATLVGCVHVDALRRLRVPLAGHSPEEWREHVHVEGPWCWILGDVCRLDEPVPARGKQGLWEWRHST